MGGGGGGGKVDLGPTLVSVNVKWLHIVSPTVHRGKYLFRHVTPSEGVTHQFYGQLYPNIIRDIDVSPQYCFHL